MANIYNEFKKTFKYYADYYRFLELNDERVYNYIIETVKKKVNNPNINDLVNMTIEVYYKQVKVRFLQDRKYLLMMFKQHFVEKDMNKSLESTNLIIVKAKYELTFEDCSLILNNYPSIKTYVEQNDTNDNYLLKKLKEITELENEDEEIKDNLYDYEFVTTDNVDAYLNEIISFPILNWKEQLALAIKIVEGNKEAREELIKSNLRLVVSIAMNYIGRGIELLDLIEAGNEGLLKAVDRFDPKLGYKFTTYATWWIKKSIQTSIYNEGRAVRVPVYYSLKISKFLKELSELELKLGRDISFKKALSSMNYTEEELMFFLIHTGEIKSLNSKVTYSSEETETELQELIPDEFNIENQVLDKEFLNGAVNIMQKILNDRLLMIIIFRWGLDGREPQTLEEIGNIMGLTKERIRQLQEKAIKKLNKNRALKAYINDEHIPRISKIVKSKTDSLFKISGKELKKISILLSPKEQELLEKRFGKDLITTVNYDMTLNELSYIYRIIYPKVIRKILENQLPHLEKSTIVPRQDSRIEKKSNKVDKNYDYKTSIENKTKKENSFFKYLGLDYEKDKPLVEKAIKLLPKEQKDAIVLEFGQDFINNPVSNKETNENIKKNLRHAKKYIKDYVTFEPIEFYEYLGLTKEDKPYIEQAVSGLLPKYLEVIKKRCGEYFLNKVDRPKPMSTQEVSLLRVAKDSIVKKITDIKKREIHNDKIYVLNLLMNDNHRELLDEQLSRTEIFNYWFNYLKQYLEENDAFTLCVYLDFNNSNYTIQDLTEIFGITEKAMLLKIKKILETLKQQYEDKNIQRTNKKGNTL